MITLTAIITAAVGYLSANVAGVGLASLFGRVAARKVAGAAASAAVRAGGRLVDRLSDEEEEEEPPKSSRRGK